MNALVGLELYELELRRQSRDKGVNEGQRTMLNRFRDFVKRLELPQGEERGIVYRIIDDEFNTLEVTAAQYGIWRMQNDVTKRAVVGQDMVEDVMVRTTFSIMPEHRGYKPFGTSAYGMPLYDPLTQYSQRYDTWGEAEQGHRNILERIRRDSATAREADRRAASLAGTAGAVRLAVSAGLTAPAPHGSMICAGRWEWWRKTER